MLDFFRKKISPDNPVRVAWHGLKGVAAAARYGFPAKKMVVIGVTGTNGKTTTVHMAEHILRTAGRRVAMMSTVETRVDGKVSKNPSKKTTQSPFVTQKFLQKCLKKGVDYVVLEASSHALHQHRLWGIPFSIAALTNITHEHLDYHRTMKKYAEAKRALFHTVKKTCHRRLPAVLKNIPHRQAMILNAEDAFYESFAEIDCPTRIVYGFSTGDIRAHHITYSKFGSQFALEIFERQFATKLQIPGSFNVENAMTAAGIALACRVDEETIIRALADFPGVPGRMETIASPRGFEVLVDFALTPDALEKLYKTLRATAKGRIIGIIGSCGDRDKEKRPIMGRIVAEHTDLTLVTDEEPYSEDPAVIMKAVMKGAAGVKTPGKDLHLIEDRYEAIEFAVKNALPDDIIVVTGMGSFDTRTMNHGPIPWDEREVVREIIGKYAD